MLEPTGKNLVYIAEKFFGQKYVLGALPFRKNQVYLNGYLHDKESLDISIIEDPYDCAEFVSLVVFLLLKKLYGANDNSKTDVRSVDCWTNFWKRDANREKFNKISISAAARTPGAILLRTTKRSRIGHIAISRGNGSTIEAMNRRNGVKNGKISGRTWDMAFTLKELSHELGSNITIDPPATIVYRLTDPYMRDTGETGKIRDLQICLKNAGYDTKGIDGIFGPGMFRAVHTYQKDNGLVVDGMIGPETAGKLGIGLGPAKAIDGKDVDSPGAKSK